MIVAALALGLSGIPASTADTGDVDPGFAYCGLTLTDLATNDSVIDMLVQDDGKIVVVAVAGNQHVLLRHLPGGAYDPAFGDGGLAPLPIWATSITQQTDGALVIGGNSALGAESIARLLPDGSPDTTFGVDGVWSSATRDNNWVKDVDIQSDGTIVALGATQTYAVTSDGAASPAWSTTTDLVTPKRLVVASDDTVVMLGGWQATTTKLAVRRLSASGVLDTAWGGDASLIDPAGDDVLARTDLALGPDGSIFALGAPSTNSRFYLARISAAGVLDTAYATSGIYSLNGLPGRALAVDSSGRALVGGSSYLNPNTNLHVARLTTSGQLDGTYGISGVAQARWDEAAEIADMAITADGSAVIGGVFENGTLHFDPETAQWDLGMVAFESDGPARPASGLIADGWGGLHGFSVCGAAEPVTSDGPYWQGWNIVRGVSAVRDNGALVLDGWGGLHPVTVNGERPTSVNGGPYWVGWDITRGVATLPDGTGGYIVDGWGGIHPFGIDGHAPPPRPTDGPYWTGWDIVRGITVNADGGGGYVVDGFGGVHPFTIGDGPTPPETFGGPYWLGWDIVRGIAASPTGLGGYVVDAYGGTHAYASGYNFPPPEAEGTPYWPGWDIVRGATMLP